MDNFINNQDANGNDLGKQIIKNSNNFYNQLKSENEFFSTLYQFISNGDVKTSLKQRIVYKVVDEVWLNKIEQVLPSLDKVIRKPNRFIVETDKVLNIEQSKNITARSIRDLAVHSDYIKQVDENGNIIPSKILNVFRDETTLTYENKFVNTLISRLFTFIQKRYKNAKTLTVDEKSTICHVNTTFDCGSFNGKADINIQINEQPTKIDIINGISADGTALSRVERLYSIVGSYVTSEFCKTLGNEFVRPPIMRTNALLRNPDLRQCLALWEFIESYNEVGYSALVDQREQEVSEKLIRNMVSAISLQCAVFRSLSADYNSNFDKDSALTVKPKFVDDVVDYDSVNFDIRDTIYKNIFSVAQNSAPLTEQLSNQELQIVDDIQVALQVGFMNETQRLNKINLMQSPIKFAEKQVIKSFMAKLIQGGSDIQHFYSVIKNTFEGFKNVSIRQGWNGESFSSSRLKIAYLTIRGKTLVLYLALNPDNFLTSKYHHKDVSNKKKYKDISFELKIKSNRALDNAVELINILADTINLVKIEREYAEYSFKYQSTPVLIKKGLIKVVENGNGDLDDKDGATVYKKSFMAKLIQGQEPVQTFYESIKNKLLSFKNVKTRDAFSSEGFRYGRNTCAILMIKGKTLYLYLALDVNAYDKNKYHFVDCSNVNKFAKVPFLLRIRSDRALKYALSLIEQMLVNMQCVPIENFENQDYHFKYQTTKYLIEKGLIKVVKRKNVAFNKKDDILEDDIEVDVAKADDQNLSETADDTDTNAQVVSQPETVSASNDEVDDTNVEVSKEDENSNLADDTDVGVVKANDENADDQQLEVALADDQTSSTDSQENERNEKEAEQIEKLFENANKEKERSMNKDFGDVDRLLENHENIFDTLDDANFYNDNNLDDDVDDDDQPNDNQSEMLQDEKPKHKRKRLEKFFISTDISKNDDIFKVFSKNEVENTIKTIKQNSATSLSDQVEGEVLICYKTLMNLNVISKFKYHKMLKSNDVNQILQAKEKLLEIHLKRIKSKK